MRNDVKESFIFSGLDWTEFLAISPAVRAELVEPVELLEPPEVVYRNLAVFQWR
jgi:hypothetical protein